MEFNENWVDFRIYQCHDQGNREHVYQRPTPPTAHGQNRVLESQRLAIYQAQSDLILDLSVRARCASDGANFLAARPLVPSFPLISLEPNYARLVSNAGQEELGHLRTLPPEQADNPGEGLSSQANRMASTSGNASSSTSQGARGILGNTSASGRARRSRLSNGQRMEAPNAANESASTSNLPNEATLVVPSSGKWQVSKITSSSGTTSASSSQDASAILGSTSSSSSTFTVQFITPPPLQSNDPSRPFKCRKCKRNFSLKANYKSHWRVHSGEKPFACELCKKRFGYRNNLTVHMMIHSQERPFQCHVCDSRFTHKHVLESHMTIHTDERRYVCQVCSRRFARKKGLRDHMTTHSGEKPYVCEVCSRGFARKKGLRDHMVIHTGKKSFPCRVCGKGFARSGNRTNHERNVCAQASNLALGNPSNSALANDPQIKALNAANIVSSTSKVSTSNPSTSNSSASNWLDEADSIVTSSDSE